MGREANAICMICEKTFSSLEAAERCENRHKQAKMVKVTKIKMGPKPVALRIYFPKYGQETTSKILCPSHRVSMMALAPASYGTGEEFPLDDCMACFVRASYTDVNGNNAGTRIPLDPWQDPIEVAREWAWSHVAIPARLRVNGTEVSIKKEEGK